jgi:hypothetical protein
MKPTKRGFFIIGLTLIYLVILFGRMYAVSHDTLEKDAGVSASSRQTK